MKKTTIIVVSLLLSLVFLDSFVLANEQFQSLSKNIAKKVVDTKQNNLCYETYTLIEDMKGELLGDNFDGEFTITYIDNNGEFRIYHNDIPKLPCYSPKIYKVKEFLTTKYNLEEAVFWEDNEFLYSELKKWLKLEVNKELKRLTRGCVLKNILVMWEPVFKRIRERIREGKMNTGTPIDILSGKKSNSKKETVLDKMNERDAIWFYVQSSNRIKHLEDICEKDPSAQDLALRATFFMIK